MASSTFALPQTRQIFVYDRKVNSKERKEENGECTFLNTIEVHRIPQEETRRWIQRQFAFVVLVVDEIMYYPRQLLLILSFRLKEYQNVKV